MNPLRWFRCGALVCILFCSTNSPSPAQDFRVNEVRRGVVYIKSFIPNVGTGVGTGFLVDENGLIFTNRHVIESGHRSHHDSVIVVGVAAKDDAERLDYFRAKVVHVVEQPESRDFAILKIAATPEYGKFQSLQLGQRTLELGENVSVLGFPYIQEGEPTISLTRGIISSARVRFDGVSFYQTDAAVNPGNSGGPLLDASGIVAGVVTLKMEGADNIGYSLHLSEIQDQRAKAEQKLAGIRPEPGPIPPDQMPDLAELAEKDSEAGSGTEARRPEWAEAKPFDPINRIWTSADEGFKTEAIYVTSKEGRVTLKKPDGSMATVPLDRLSELDRYYVQAMESPWKDEGRLPAPPPAVVALKERQIHGIFDFQEESEQLFNKLLRLAIETRSQDPAAAYVCLCEASRVAAQDSQFELMFVTLAGLEKWYEIEIRLLPLQTEVLTIAESSATDRLHYVQVFAFALQLIEFAEVRRDFVSGTKLVDLARSVVGRLRSGEMLNIIREREQRFKEFKAAFDLSEAARARLLEEPNNRKAHLAIGRFMVLFDQQWTAESLQHLADGNDPRFAAAAQMELADPTTAKSRLAVADAWWALGETDDKTFNQHGLFAHAIQWYERCFDDLSALDRTKAEQRMAKFETQYGDGESKAIRKDGVAHSPGRRYAFGGRSAWPPFLAPSRVSVTREGLHNVGDDFIHTRESNFLSQDFRFEALLTLNRDEGISFVGTGDLFDQDQRSEPKNSAHFRIHSPGRHNGELQIQLPGGNGEIIGRLRKECTMRVSVSKRGNAVTLNIDVDDDGPTPDDIERTIPDIREAGPELNSKNVYLFFGGGGTFSEVRLIRGAWTAPKERELESSPPFPAGKLDSGELQGISAASDYLEFSTALISRQGLEVKPETMVRTKRADLLLHDFRFQLVLTIPESSKRNPLDRAVFVGMGLGADGRAREIDESIRIRFSPLDEHVGKGEVNVGKSGSVQALGNLTKAGTHRVIIEKEGKAVTFRVDIDKDGESPDDLQAVIPDIDEHAPFLHSKNSYLFFGGDAYFTHVGLKIER